MDFDYFYNREAERFNFLKVPEILVDGEEFKGLSAEAIILYSMLLKRTGMSFKNNWVDKEGRVFIYFTVEEIMRRRNISKPTAIKTLDELDMKKGIGLIERRRRGLGKPNIIYVKDFMSVFRSECKNYTSEVKELHSGDVDFTFQEVKKVHGSNTNINYPDYSDPDNSFLGEKASAKKYGSFQNVLLSDEDLSDLEKKLGSKLDNYIERLGAYMSSTGKSYKNHKATILTWYFKDQGVKQSSKSNIPTLEEYERGDFL